MAKIGGGGFGTTLVLAVLLVVLALAAGVGIARYGDQIPWLAPIIGQPTQTSEGVVQGIQDLDELATVRYTTQVIVTEEENARILTHPLPEWIGGERILLIAVGEVTAGIDLDQIGKDDVRVDGKRVTINLPKPRILGANLDENQTKLYDRDRGVLKIQGNDELLEEARRDAEDRMVDLARENDIMEEAQNNAEDSIRDFLTTLGYEEIVFT